MEPLEAIKRRFELLAPGLDERKRRLLAAEKRWRSAGAVACGGAGDGRVAAGDRAGIRELQAAESRPPGPGAATGRRAETAVEKDPGAAGGAGAAGRAGHAGGSGIAAAVDLQERAEAGGGAAGAGAPVSHRMVAELLRTLEYSLQANRKVLEGSQHPDRNAQFEYLNAQVQAQLAAGDPAISVDAKKKELVGPFKNGGRELRPKGHPEPVRVHDFVDKELGRATPYGVYDLAQNQGWVTVGIDHDTAAFAVASIDAGGRRWARRPTLGRPAC